MIKIHPGNYESITSETGKDLEVIKNWCICSFVL